jgi:hypothetical protein
MSLPEAGPQGRGGGIQLRRVRRRPAWLQHRAQREGDHRFSTSTPNSRIDRRPATPSSDERIHDAYLGGEESRRRDDLRRPAPSRRFETSLKRLRCANSSRSVTAQRTGEPDPKRKFLCAAVAGMTPHYFAELFKRSTGRLPSGMSFTENRRANRVFGTPGPGVIEGWTRCWLSEPGPFCPDVSQILRQPLKISIVRMCESVGMAQTVCVLPSAEDCQRLLAIVADRNRPLKHAQRAHIRLCSADH